MCLVSPQAHFCTVMPNTVVALGVESKREILRAQLSQLQQVILTEKRVLQDLISLIRFYGPGPAANRAREDYLAQVCLEMPVLFRKSPLTCFVIVSTEEKV